MPFRPPAQSLKHSIRFKGNTAFVRATTMPFGTSVTRPTLHALQKRSEEHGFSLRRLRITLRRQIVVKLSRHRSVSVLVRAVPSSFATSRAQGSAPTVLSRARPPDARVALTSPCKGRRNVSLPTHVVAMQYRLHQSPRKRASKYRQWFYAAFERRKMRYCFYELTTAQLIVHR